MTTVHSSTARPAGGNRAMQPSLFQVMGVRDPALRVDVTAPPSRDTHNIVRASRPQPGPPKNKSSSGQHASFSDVKW